MKQRVIALCIAFAMLISLIPSTAIVSSATSSQSGDTTRRLTDVKVYDESNTLTGDYEFHYDGDFLTGVTSRTYGEYAYEASVVLTYDTAGRLISRISGDPDTPGMNSGSKYTYNSAGQLISSLHWEGGAVEETYEYDSAGNRIRAIEDYDAGKTITEYSYNEDGLLSSAIETSTEEWSGDTWTETIVYSYDSQSRISKVSCTGGYTDALTTYYYQYQPFVLSEYIDSYGYSNTNLLLQDANGYTLHSFYLSDPELFADARGYLAKVVDTKSYSNEVQTYVFYYDGIAAEATGDTSDSNQSGAWNQVYYDFIIQDRKDADSSEDWEWVGYELVYLDDDTIPELWITYSSWAAGCRIVSYRDGKLTQELIGSGTLSYEEYGNAFHHSYGHMGLYFDTIFKLENGELVTVAEGRNETTINEDGSQNYDVMNYFWNDTQVSEEAYAQNIESLVSPDVAKETSYDAQYSYVEILDYLSSVKLEETAELKVYTTFPYATLGVDQTAKLLITLLVNGEPTPIQEFALGNNNSEVIDLIDTKDADGVRVLTFKTKSPGVANLTFTEGATGATVSIEMTVEEMCSFYRCSNFPIPDASSFPIHVADFQCTENSDGTHNVKFNAYNTSYAYGAAVVYDETGAFWGCIPLNPKYDGTGMEYIANGFWQSWEQTWYWIDGDKEFYEVAGNAMLTEVEFNSIPQNAKIVITADGRESVYPVLYTGIDIFLKVAFYSANIDLKINVYQKSVKEFVVALLKALPDDAAQNTIQTLTTDISMALIDGVNSESVEKIYQAVWNMFENLGLNADEMLKDVLSGLGYSVADTVVIAAVPAYSFVDLVNKIVAVAWLFVDYDSNLDRGKMEIHCVEHASNNQLINSSVVVIQQSEFSKDTILDAYVVTDAEELDTIPDSVTSNIENYSVYNITLRESGAEVQPGEEIEIRIPIPENVNPDKCVIYRLEDNGTLTLLPSTIENGYIVFTTTHLSYYIVGESTDETAAPSSETTGIIWVVVGAVGITLGLTVMALLLKRKKRTT